MGELYVVIRHDSTFDRICVAVEPETEIGRERECAIWLPDSRVSRKHAVIVRKDSHFLIRDLDSRNGTHVDDRRITQDQILQDGAEIRIGPFRLKIRFEMDAAQRDTACLDDSTRTEAIPTKRDDEFDIGFERLTPKQTRVFKLLLQGLLEKEVATQLGITGNTVHEHVKAIYRALSVSTRGELISRGMAWLGRNQPKSGA